MFVYFLLLSQKKKINIEREINILMNKHLNQQKEKWTYKGYIQQTDKLYIFIKLNSKKKELFRKRVLARNNKWWWCIIDEICNKRHILNFPIHEIVTKLFLHNPILIYLKNNDGLAHPIPISLYYGQNAAFLPFNFVFGPKTSDDINGPYGPYYYLETYNKAVRYGGWTNDYSQLKKANINISDENGKIYKGGIVRYAVFLGNKLKVILKPTKKKTTLRYKQNKKLSQIFLKDPELFSENRI